MRYLLGLAVPLLSASLCFGQVPTAKATLVLETGGHNTPVRQALFTPDSKTLITISHDRTIRFWDVNTGQALRVLRTPIASAHAGELNVAALSPDGKTLAVAGVPFFNGNKETHPSPIFLINVESGQIDKALREHDRPINALAFSADGKRLASGGRDPDIRIWDVAAGKSVRQLKGHTGWITSLALSPDGTRLVSAGPPTPFTTADAERSAWIWDVRTGEVKAKLEGRHRTAVHQVAWSPDGNRVVTASGEETGDNHCAVWDRDGKHVGNLPYPNKRNYRCLSLAFTPDSKLALLSLLDDKEVNVCELDLATRTERLHYAAGNYLNGKVAGGYTVASPDGKWVVLADDRHHHSHLYDRVSGKQLRSFAGRGRVATSVAWVKDKNADHAVIAWRISRTGENFDPHAPIDSAFYEASFQPDTLEVGPAPEGDDKVYQRNRYRQGPLELQVDGTKVKLLRDGKATDIKLPTAGPVNAAALSFVSADRAVAGKKENLLLFDVSPEGKGKTLDFRPASHGQLLSVAPSPNNNGLFLSSADDQVLRIWTVEKHAPLLSLFVVPGPMGRRGRDAEWIAWTPQGYYAASINGERLMGWHINGEGDQMGTFHPAAHFRARLYRPDVIKLVLKEGSVDKALKKADAARGEESAPIDVEQVLPPEVTMTTSALKGVAKKGKTLIKAEGRSQSKDPIVALQLLLDERPYPGEGGLVTFKNPKTGLATAKWEIEMPGGQHQLRVLARTRSSLGTSRGMGVLQEDNPTPERKQPALYVLAVGVDAYPKPWELKGAVNDATKLEKVFKDYSKPLFTTVETRLITDKKASKQGILEGLAWLKSKMTPSDVGVFFFAGHGVQDKKKEYYLLSQDGDPLAPNPSALSRAEIKEKLQGIPGRILVMLDACHSGAIGMLDGLTRDLIDEDCGVVVLCAAMSKEVALEKQGHGYLTKAMIEGLSGKADKREGSVYLHHLVAYVIDKVADLSENKQHPTVGQPPSVQSFGLSKPAGEK